MFGESSVFMSTVRTQIPPPKRISFSATRKNVCRPAKKVKRDPEQLDPETPFSASCSRIKLLSSYPPGRIMSALEEEMLVRNTHSLPLISDLDGKYLREVEIPWVVGLVRKAQVSAKGWDRPVQLGNGNR